jgi:hypothetical protein
VLVQPCPEEALEVVEPEFLPELLLRLLADPPRFDGGRQVLEQAVGG